MPSSKRKAWSEFRDFVSATLDLFQAGKVTVPELVQRIKAAIDRSPKELPKVAVGSLTVKDVEKGFRLKRSSQRRAWMDPPIRILHFDPGYSEFSALSKPISILLT